MEIGGEETNGMRKKTRALRYIQFNLVGILGFLVQLSALALLHHVFHIHYRISTLLAVELAIINNFIWHERWTWKGGSLDSVRDRLARLWQFNAANGLVSLLGNLLLMELLLNTTQLPVLAANLIAVLICSMSNFFISLRIFRTPERSESKPCTLTTVSGSRLSETDSAA